MKRILASAIVLLSSAFLCLAQNNVTASVDIVGVAGAGTLPKPSYHSKATGVVVVKVTVNEKGKVTEAIPGFTGSTTDNKVLLAAAKEAALKARFKMADNVNDLCTGTIIYGFGTTLEADNVPGKGVSHNGYISIGDLLDYHTDGSYKIQGFFFGIESEDSLRFYVYEKVDEILPVQLADTPQAREQFQKLLFFKGGEPIDIEGELISMVISEQTLKGLTNATILTMPMPDRPVEEEVAPSKDKPRSIQVMPKFKGKEPKYFSLWVNKHLKYPASAKKKYLEGIVKVMFTIDIDGTVTDVHVIKGVCSALDAEAVRVVSSSPKWTPGMSDGEPVRVSFTFPVVFQLSH